MLPDLPSELIYCILSFCTAKAILSFSKTCKKFKAIGDDQRMWRRMCIEKEWFAFWDTSRTFDDWRSVYIWHMLAYQEMHHPGFGQTTKGYNGEILDGLPNGRGILVTHLESGGRNVYKGTWKNGKKHGHGIELQQNSVYIGEFYEGKRQGRGCLIQTNAKYYGTFFDDKLHGRGSIVYVCGDKYWGTFAAGKIDGTGVHLDKDGTIYSGIFHENSCKGQGRVFYPDGSVYVGDVLKKHRHGFGTYYWSDGDTFTGFWNNDYRVYGKFTSRNRATVVDQSFAADTLLDTDVKLISHKRKIDEVH